MSPESRELIRDRDFQQGFAMLAPTGGGREMGRIQSSDSPAPPVWQVAQWHSRFVFSNFTAASLDHLCVSNAGKWLRLTRESSSPPVLALGVDSRPEYDGRLRRSPSEPWVHLLVQQSIEGAPSLAELTALQVRFAARLLETNTFRPDGHSPGLHAAQFQLVLTLNNTRRGSQGFGDYLWFVVPVYDDRYEVPPSHIAQDFAVTKGKLIYNPGAAALSSSNVRAGGWTQFDFDLRPWLERALKVAWEKGYLRDSRNLADYRLAHLNVGWEVPGLNRVTMELRGLSLRASRR